MSDLMSHFRYLITEVASLLHLSFSVLKFSSQQLYRSVSLVAGVLENSASGRAFGAGARSAAGLAFGTGDDPRSKLVLESKGADENYRTHQRRRRGTQTQHLWLQHRLHIFHKRFQSDWYDVHESNGAEIDGIA